MDHSIYESNSQQLLFSEITLEKFILNGWKWVPKDENLLKWMNEATVFMNPQYAHQKSETTMGSKDFGHYSSIYCGLQNLQIVLIFLDFMVKE